MPVYTMVDRWRVGGFQKSNYTNMNGLDLYGNLALGQEWSSFGVVGCFVLFVFRNIPRNQALRPIYCKTSPIYCKTRFNIAPISCTNSLAIGILLFPFPFYPNYPLIYPQPLSHISTPRPHHKFTFPYPNICPD